MRHSDHLRTDRRGPGQRASSLASASIALVFALAFALALAAVSVGCAGKVETQPLEVATGRNADTSHDGLVRMTGSALQAIWVKPGADVRHYSRLLIGDVRMAYKRPPRSGGSSRRRGNFPLDRSQVERVEAALRDALTEEIEQSESWSMAEEPGDDVLLIEPSLIDLVVNVPPNQQPRQNVYTTSVGEATLVLEVRDSQTGEILARVADRSQARAPGASSQQLVWSNPVTNASAVRSTFRRWASIFMARLDTAHRLAAEAEAGEKEGAEREGEESDEAAG